MTTTSYPAVGTGGFTELEWAEYFDGQDGILNDYAGTALSLTRIDAGNIARYSPGKIKVGGYVLEVTANHDLTVSTAAATYYTWVCYDPALNVADGGGAASAAGPCTIGISSGLPSTAGGKQYVLLDKIVRGASQALTAATVTSLRRWMSVAVEWEGALSPESVESNYPRGTLRFDRTEDRLMVRTMDAAGSAMEWRSLVDDRYAYKTATESVTSSTTLQDDDTLFLTLPPGFWEVTAWLAVSGAAAGDVKTAWNFSGTSDSLYAARSCLGPAAGTTDTTSSSVVLRAAGQTVQMAYGVDGTGTSAILEELTLKVTAEGTLTLRWAQNTSSATPTVMNIGSRILARRVG